MGDFLVCRSREAHHPPNLEKSPFSAPIGGSVDSDAAIWRFKLSKDKAERLNLVLRAARNVNRLPVKEKDRANGVGPNLELKFPWQKEQKRNDRLFHIYR